MKLIKSWRELTLMVAVTLVGCGLLWQSTRLYNWDDTQLKLYNQGLAFFKEGKVDEAMLAFDNSLDVYRAHQSRPWLERTLYPGPSTEAAALAHAKKAVLFIIKQKAPEAVTSFKDSIKLNPGGEQFKELSPEQIRVLSEQSMVVKHNLELMFKKNPSMAQGEGKGKGKGKGEKKGKPRPGDEPGNQPGRGNKDDI